LKTNHTRILNAYLARLTTKDLENIVQANNDWQHSAINHGNNTQLKAQENFMAAISQAISNVIQHDIINIEKIILEEVAL
jgi:hypothetical protein